MDLVIKDDSGGSGHAHKRADHERFFPTKVRLTLTQVSAGSKYDPGPAPKFELKRIANSKSFSQIHAINASLESIGTKEVTEAGISSTKGFFRRGVEELDIPILKDFTNVEAYALSDTGMVVGYVSRPFQAVGGSVKAFVWNTKTNEQKFLAPLPTDIVCHAQDISADGHRITGYSIGNEPPRMRPCIWEWKETDKEYVPQELSSVLPNNPFLQVGHVIISPDGKRIAATLSEKQVSPFEYDCSLYVWDRDAKGKWARTKISDEEPKLRDLNNNGTMVGSVKLEGITRACVVDIRGKLNLIDLLTGDVSSEAYGINDAGTVVGLSDDPPGETGAPQPFVYEKGAVSQLELSSNTQSGAALAINQQGAIGGYLLEGTEEEAAVTAFIRIPKKNP